MDLLTSERNTLLRHLALDAGFRSVMGMLEAAATDSVSPAICTNKGCQTVTETEPDQSEGVCESCGQNTVVSALYLAGLI
jgi:hypothetical protein